jgi:hypothetical protein
MAAYDASTISHPFAHPSETAGALSPPMSTTHGFAVPISSPVSRSPPKGTPSSYGRVVQKRWRVGGSGAAESPGQTRPSQQMSGRGRTGSSEGLRTGSLSGRLRSVSDLEKSGLVTSSEKGRLKDLIISGDESLRNALEKYDYVPTSRV